MMTKNKQENLESETNVTFETFEPKIDPKTGLLQSVEIIWLHNLFNTSTFNSNYQPYEVEQCAKFLFNQLDAFNERYDDIKKEYDELYEKYGEAWEQARKGQQPSITNGTIQKTQSINLNEINDALEKQKQ